MSFEVYTQVPNRSEVSDDRFRDAVEGVRGVMLWLPFPVEGYELVERTHERHFSARPTVWLALDCMLEDRMLELNQDGFFERGERITMPATGL